MEIHPANAQAFQRNSIPAVALKGAAHDENQKSCAQIPCKATVDFKLPRHPILLAAATDGIAEEFLGMEDPDGEGERGQIIAHGIDFVIPSLKKEELEAIDGGMEVVLQDGQEGIEEAEVSAVGATDEGTGGEEGFGHCFWGVRDFGFCRRVGFRFFELQATGIGFRILFWGFDYCRRG